MQEQEKRATGIYPVALLLYRFVSGAGRKQLLDRNLQNRGKPCQFGVGDGAPAAFDPGNGTAANIDRLRFKPLGQLLLAQPLLLSYTPYRFANKIQLLAVNDSRHFTPRVLR